uniref:Par3/HAL N-terminal domain-containing protein n=1 Tax=Octactis speculum TaxID=3111310 RepID=A0A7S2FZY6_9STRA|mmetsp:Transcript_35804/g.48361  ORF Transcript_35804/g.48361 Transcript_35804/m.48361 type:complete len:107 (+) Transcript_35804:13-333(+)|eukprot:CAMPEP_0185766442 /NCGR_PEP_ID=MMETSP1174-20130828/37273_1 /TAXON_ID=35687 /ORGANISM="Dictyocha speculum, Strain CCMP1381" /LENGTH=106 /DNA_ID=CAMNT_0028450145 /DNA_START=21 /DNA_END=341 /DNA_ORIENTATION=-
MSSAEQQQAAQIETCLIIYVQVHEKEFEVSVGGGTQRISWLGHVGIARYDESSYEGWKELGVPTSVDKLDEKDKVSSNLNMSQVIKEVLVDGDRIRVSTSMSPVDN